MRIVRAYTSEPASPRVPKKTLQERMARQAAIERQLSRYLPLNCGHYTTLEALDIYLAWRPKPGKAMCETCHKWVDISKPPAPVVLPQEPMF